MLLFQVITFCSDAYFQTPQQEIEKRPSISYMEYLTIQEL